MRRNSALLALLALAALACRAHSFKILIPPGKTECISETIDAEHFEVPGGPRIEGAMFVSGPTPSTSPLVTIRVLSPQGDLLWQQPAVATEAHFNVAAKGPGSYRACFFNAIDSYSDAVVDLVYFTLGHLRKPGAALTVPKGTSDMRSKEVAAKEHIDASRRTLTSMAELLAIVQGEQRYLQRKLNRHRETTESNNRRTMFYTWLEVAALLGASTVQILVIKRFFNGPTRFKLGV